eukprot:CAMPEP_0175703384 /NCGR_PEP_ID=MMETSP0097-20121207/36491_1 /TAXON_ID=311494 /ORGANISM="Alexandrium monilatum, Strain CCMP3105" /LENGTH=283 /DNA_ID=CAMNT_0017010675 /DNA_START=17 /DNA_END=868 /DNA_ORIENTATION=+
MAEKDVAHAAAAPEEAPEAAPEAAPGATPKAMAEAAPEEAAAGSLEVQVANLMTGALVATVPLGPGEDCGVLKARIAEQAGKPKGKIRLVLDGDALADSWRPPSGADPVRLGLVIVQRTEPDHVEPLPLLQGNYWSDHSRQFDDGPLIRKLLEEDPTAELASVRLTQSEGCVMGIRCKYRTQDGVVEAEPHDEEGYGWYASHWPRRDSVELELAPGERIVRVVARTGEIMDRLELHTDQGQCVAAGGAGGADRRVEIEQGSHVIGFSGHRNGGVLIRLGFHIV